MNQIDRLPRPAFPARPASLAHHHTGSLDGLRAHAEFRRQFLHRQRILLHAQSFLMVRLSTADHTGMSEYWKVPCLGLLRTVRDE